MVLCHPVPWSFVAKVPSPLSFRGQFLMNVGCSKRSVCLVKQISLLEVASTCSAASHVVVDLLESFMLLTQAALQATHRCTPAPCGMRAALPTVLFLILRCPCHISLSQVVTRLQFQEWTTCICSLVLFFEQVRGKTRHCQKLSPLFWPSDPML